MSLKNTLDNYPDISFIENLSLEDLQSQMINDFQNKYLELTGQEISLPQADPVRLILYAATLQLYQGMQYIDAAGKQSFLKYAFGKYLDNMGALKGIVRNEGEAAKTKIRFTLSAARPGAIIIPMGTRVTPGGNVFFYTEEESAIPIGETYVDVPAVCAEIGEVGNNFEVDAIKVLVDKIPYVAEVRNIQPSSGGAEIESDANLAERIYLAPSSYSTAGPDDAYRYWVKEYNPDIKDVKVYSPVPGVVDIRFILQDGELPTQGMIEGVEEYLMDGERRPLTDYVTVAAPEVHPYDVKIKYWINDSDKNKAAAVQKNVDAAVSGFAYWQKSQIGRDINPSMLNHYIMQAGAKRVEVLEPAFLVIGEAALAVLNNVEVEFGGIERD